VTLSPDCQTISTGLKNPSRLGLDRLALKRNALRQEKIVEEIEVILSSAQAFAKAPPTGVCHVSCKP
jgi:hypothetical protein